MISRRGLYLLFIFMSLVVFACDTLTNSIHFTPTDNLPIWPQQGYSPRRTGNPYGYNQIITPINGTTKSWVDTLPSGTDAVYPTVDTKGNIYYLHVNSDNITSILYKFSSEGRKLWQITDSSLIPSFGNGLGLSANEKYIYIPCYTGLFCFDSSGNFQWKYNGNSQYSNNSMPAIGKDGTIYSVIGVNSLKAINPNGGLKWSVNNAIGSPSLDKEENIYIGWTDGQIGSTNNGIAKYDINGTQIWKFPLTKPPFGICIDGNNNLYFQYGNSVETGLVSLDSRGSLRWKKLFALGDSLSFNFWATPLISSANFLFASACICENENVYRGIVKIDTSGNVVSKIKIGFDLPFRSIDELFFDSNENIYFRSVYEYGSVTKDGIIRFMENKNVGNFTLSIDGKLIFVINENDFNILVSIK